jgi:chromatin assembly factor 1 subunit B
MNTPPQTPRSTTGSVSGSVTGLKRDASESEKEEAGTKEPEKKKRRIAPTAVPDGS